MSKVVSIFSKPKKKEKSEGVDFNALFEDAIEKNRKNKERMKQERLKANKSTLRSYRIKG